MLAQKSGHPLCVGLLFLVIGHSLVVHCSLLLSDVIFMNYEPLICDDNYYREIKVASLLVKIAFQIKDQQYLITNRNLIRRTTGQAQIYYANHTAQTEEFYNFLKEKNTMIQFQDYLHATTMSVKMAVTIFGHRTTKTSELMNSYKLDDECTVKECINFFYLNSKMADEEAAFTYLVTVDLHNVPVVHRKTEVKFDIVPNEVEQILCRIDMILFSADQADRQQLIEFSSGHGALRQYGIPYVAKQVNTNETQFVQKMTYFNFLHCFDGPCEGGRHKGLITLNGGDGLYRRFFFLEDRYMEVDERILFENDGMIRQWR